MLAGAFGLSVPDHRRTRVDSGDLPDLAPTERRADTVVVLTDGDDVPVLAVVVEAQTSEDRGKRWTWPAYLATLRARLRCPTVLLVVCSKDRTARWCAKPIDLGHPGWTLSPLVLGPARIPVVTDADQAASNPQLAGLSAIVHGAHPERDKVFHAFLSALRFVDPADGPLYYEIVLAALPKSARLRLEAFMTTGTFQYKSQFARQYISQGRAEGEAEAVLAVLDARGIDVPDDMKSRITTCTDLKQLTTWVRRAAVAEKVDDLFR